MNTVIILQYQREYMNFLPEASNTGAHISLEFFKRKFPWANKRDYTYNEWRALEDRYKNWKWITLVIVFFFFFFLTLFWAAVCYHVYKGLFYVLTPADAMFLPAEWLSFSIAGFFLMLMTLYIFTEKLQQILLTVNYDEFEDYYNTAQGYDNHKAGFFLAQLSLPLAIIAIYFSFTAHVFIKAESFYYKSMFDISGKEYNYEDIDELVYYKAYQAKDGTIHSDGGQYKIIIKDGSKISPGFYFGNAEKAAPFVELLHEKSGIAIDTQKVLLFKDK